MPSLEMKISADQPSGLSALDRPNSYIGRSVPRPNLDRLTQGRGQYVSDVVLPRMVHVAFLRSPHAHARIKNIKADPAKSAPGVVAVVTGAELGNVITPWVGVLTHLKGIKSAPQHAIAVDRACWQGEAICAVVARSRAEAEDACALIDVEYEPLPAVTDAETALDRATPVIHPDLGDNLTFERALVTGDPDKAFADSDAVVETTFVFGRHTGVTNEARAIVADWNPGEQRLTVYQGTQAPHMTQNIFARHLGLESHQVRVLTKDVGGSFGIKVHIYADEMATVALAKLLSGRSNLSPTGSKVSSPIFMPAIIASRAKIGVKKDGTITAFEIDDLTGIGPYSVYPRTSGIEANQVVNLVGGPYTCPNYRARARVVFQNKNVMCQYRAVGHPIATAVTEGLVELAAAKIGMDPAELRRRNLFADDAYPATGAAGLKFERLSHHASLDKILAMMDYEKLRAEQAELRPRGIYRGIGFASFIEVTNPSAAFYGVGGARISSQDGATLRLDATGAVFVHSGVDRARPGRGIGAGAMRGDVLRGADRARARHHRRYRQHALWRRHLGVTRRRHRRRSSLAGRQGAARQRPCRRRLASCKPTRKHSTSASGLVVDADTGRERLPLEEVARIVYFRPDTLPPGFQAEFIVTRHYVPRAWPFAFTNGVQASYLEVDTKTGDDKIA